MNTILTDDELKAECRVGFGIDPVLDGNLIAYARAVEAAVLAKLERQEPVAWLHKGGHVQVRAPYLSQEAVKAYCTNGQWAPLYTHPAPQQADRQRVPEGHALVPVEILDRFPEMNPSNYDHDDVCELNAWGVELVLAAAPEAPAQADRQRVPEWHEDVQKVAAENDLEPEFIELVFNELMPVFMSDKEAAGYVTLPLDRLIECDSYGVHGSDFYRCRVCDGESGAGVLNKGISHASDCPLAAAPEAPAQAKEISPEFTDTARAALLWVLWHHQGGSSDVGQPIRFALGMGQYEKMNAHQVREAKRWAALNPKPTHEAPAQADDTDGPMLDGEGWTITLADGHSGPGWYAHCADCPEEGAVFVAAAPEAPAQAEQTKCVPCPTCGANTASTNPANWCACPKTPAQASAVDERAAFEAWIQSEVSGEWIDLSPMNGANGRSYSTFATYRNKDVEALWSGWQARAALAQKGGQ